MTRNARSLTPTVRGRALLSFAALSVAAGGVLAAVALRSGPDPDAAILVVDDAVAASTPSTIPPLEAPAEFDDNDEPDVASAAVVPATAEPTERLPDGRPLSPLARLLDEPGSAIPEPVDARAQPVGLRIDDIFVDGPVRPVGLEADGQLEVPDETEIGWYRYGAAPGDPGATVLAAHVTWNGTYGPFLNLGALEPGETIEVTLDDGTTRLYEVIERTMYDKTELPRERIWRTTGPETLVLITCGGDFNPDINRYDDNIVVYAVPVG